MKVNESITTVPIAVQTLTKQELDLIEQATALGWVAQPREEFLIELGQQIACRLRPRTGSNVYQMAAFNLPSFPRRLAEDFFSGGPVTTDTQSCITWRWEEEHWHHMHSFLSNLMEFQGEACAGQSKGLKTDSEFVCRVLATIIPPLEVSWVAMARGVTRLYINMMMYALVDHNGELHPPKDANRIEIALTPTLQALIRQQVLSDAGAMADQLHPMAPGFLRQMGRLQQAMIAQARLAQQEASVPPPQKGGKRRSKEPLYEVSQVLDERGTGANHSYLVRWAGYHPSWEAWRLADWQGQPGDPVETWERASSPTLQTTQALQDWKEQQRRRRLA